MMSAELESDDHAQVSIKQGPTFTIAGYPHHLDRGKQLTSANFVA